MSTTEMHRHASAVGAYGLRLAGVERARRLLSTAPPTWPELCIEHRVMRGADGLAIEQFVSDDRAAFRLQGDHGVAHVERDPLSVQFTTRQPLDDHAIVHPFLAMPAAIVSRWLGRDALHAGAFVTGSGAWALLGDKGTGKSSTLGHLAARGVAVVTDDVLVIDQGNVMAGPRCIDLRPDAALHLERGHSIGMVGGRPRWRMAAGAVTGVMPLRGWVVPTWADRVELVPIAVTQRLPLIVANLALRVPPREPERFLALAALPAWELRRPRRWDALGHAASRLLDELGG